MNNLNWDKSFEAYEEKIEYLDNALASHKFEKNAEVEVYNQIEIALPIF